MSIVNAKGATIVNLVPVVVIAVVSSLKAPPIVIGDVIPFITNRLPAVPKYVVELTESPKCNEVGSDPVTIFALLSVVPEGRFGAFANDKVPFRVVVLFAVLPIVIAVAPLVVLFPIPIVVFEVLLLPIWI